MGGRGSSSATSGAIASSVSQSVATKSGGGSQYIEELANKVAYNGESDPFGISVYRDKLSDVFSDMAENGEPDWLPASALGTVEFANLQDTVSKFKEEHKELFPELYGDTIGAFTEQDNRAREIITMQRYARQHRMEDGLKYRIPEIIVGGDGMNEYWLDSGAVMALYAMQDTVRGKTSYRTIKRSGQYVNEGWQTR